jgi:hypothetical protein
MLFARFLAESDLLVEPATGMAVTLDECRELARERGVDWLELASSFATRMLPQIFRTGDPLLDVELPPETRSELEKALEALPREVFTADDSLGWVYQFWQSERKDEVNRSERKIGPEELPAVTQLFTEDYMVLFLLHNTLGAWWAGKVLAVNPELANNAADEIEICAACKVGGIDWTYLRFVREDGKPWRPAAGTFEDWPKLSRGIRLLDPCMGSGHFLVFALPILVALRMAEEGFPEQEAVDAVLRDNLYGLEIDSRCTQIAAFNLALAAWRRVGYRPLPRLHLACSGLSIGVSKAEWLKMAEQTTAAAPLPPERDLFGTKENLFSARIKGGFSRLYDLFEQAPMLGSLIDPRRMTGDIEAVDYLQLEPLIAPMLAAARTDEMTELAVAAQGMMKAAEILGSRFTLVVTNVPYLGRGKQEEVLRVFSEERYPDAKSDIATCFIRRSLQSCVAGGCVALVTPQSWLFLASYRALRQSLLESVEWNTVARLGPRAFEAIGGEVVNVALVSLTHRSRLDGHTFTGIDVKNAPDPIAKSLELRRGSLALVNQSQQLGNPDARVTLEAQGQLERLQVYCTSCLGLGTGDFSHYGRCFWEFPSLTSSWAFLQGPVETPRLWGGREHVVAWDYSVDRVRGMTDGERIQIHNQDQSGRLAWGKHGVAVGLMGSLKPTVYSGERHEKAVAALIPKSPDLLPALWTFCSSNEFHSLVRQLDHNVIVSNGTLVKIPFDVTEWKRLAAEKYPNGLPRPHSDDPMQWLFNGHPKGAEHPLHVAVARLLGYRWPRQTGSSFPDCPTHGPDGLEKHADPDEIVPLTPLRGEAPAAERLIALLADAFGPAWSAAKLAGLLANAGFEGKSLDDWLRDGFFAQHCDLFHQRPFVWHICDGRRDGFHALVNYHRLVGPAGEGRRVLETLLYAYLGDWIDRQRADQRAGVEGADGRLAAAEQLKGELEKILAGNPPYDIFVRWKPLHEQANGWEPDINDGVRLNIRPFMAARPLNARSRGACVLRSTPRIKWDKDRGKEPNRPREDFPWFWSCDGVSTDFPGGREFDGNRWNDLHYSRLVKEAARERHSKLS